MVKITIRLPVAARDTVAPEKPFPFLRLPPEIRNKICRYSLVQARRISGLDQPPLTRINSQVRSEALPIYYSENSFRLIIPAPSDSDSRLRWADLIRGFRAFKTGRTGGQGGGGSLRFVQDIKCVLCDSRSRVTDWDMMLAFGVSARRRQHPRRVVAVDTRASKSVPSAAPAWHDRAAVQAYFFTALKSVFGDPTDTCVQRFVTTVAMVAIECPIATANFEFSMEAFSWDLQYYWE